jgi:hypothetical protein
MTAEILSIVHPFVGKSEIDILANLSMAPSELIHSLNPSKTSFIMLLSTSVAAIIDL